MASDLVILLGDSEPELPHARVIRCELEADPLEAVPDGARVAVFTTARREDSGRVLAALERKGIEVGLLTTNLARRAELERDMEQAARERCDFFLTELKAAAIEVVAERAARDGIPVGFLRNRLVRLPGEADPDQELWRLFEEVRTGAEAQA